MADLDDIEAAQAVKVIGATLDGTETKPVKVSDNQDMGISDTLDVSAVYASLPVGTTAVELKVGGSPLANRKYVQFQPRDKGIFFGYSSGVTISNGTEVFKNSLILLPIGPNLSVWFIADAVSKSLRIGELA